MKTQFDTKLRVKWRCPSNIAIVKYWGKKANQIPCNASLSMTLNNAFTEVETEIEKRESDGKVNLCYYFNGELNEEFGERVANYIESNTNSFSFVLSHSITMRSTNSFPHSAGIASSASAFGAIALTLLDLEYKLTGKEITTEFYREASNLARLGSGSASRSLFAGYAVWGKNASVVESSDNFAIQLDDIHPVFKRYKDAILIVEDEPKKVSSSAGHSLMNDHPFAFSRFDQANQRVKELVTILKNGDVADFIAISESEALTLHAMMMTSKDYYLLFKPGTIEIIEKIIAFRKENNIAVCFTLDAGPNVHVLYPDESSELVEKFINEELMDFCKGLLFDKIGEGPVKIEVN